jgi:uncharacterized protein YciI
MALFAVTTARGPNWDTGLGMREQPRWPEHAAFADGLVDSGVIVVGGPISGDDPEDVALLAVQATDEDAVRSVFDVDPWVVDGVLRIKRVRAWTWWLDGTARRTPAD